MIAEPLRGRRLRCPSPGGTGSLADLEHAQALILEFLNSRLRLRHEGRRPAYMMNLLGRALTIASPRDAQRACWRQSMRQGRCLCGSVKYELEGEPLVVAHSFVEPRQSLALDADESGSSGPAGCAAHSGAPSPEPARAARARGPVRRSRRGRVAVALGLRRQVDAAVLLRAMIDSLLGAAEFERTIGQHRPLLAPAIEHVLVIPGRT